MKNSSGLTGRDVLVLAISSEDEDWRVYADMAPEENEHRRRLIHVFGKRFCQQAAGRPGADRNGA